MIVFIVNKAPRHGYENSLISITEGRIFYSMLESAGISHYGVRYLVKDDLSLLRELKPRVVIPLDNPSYSALTGHGNIRKYRGTVTQKDGYLVMPTIHPLTIQKEWLLRPLAIIDLQKAAKMNRKDYKHEPMERIRTIVPTLNQVAKDLEFIQTHKLPISFDLETTFSSPSTPLSILTIGFATSKERSFCIPFWSYKTGTHYWTEGEEAWIWSRLKEILEDPSIPKIAQHFQFDAGALLFLYGIKVQGLLIDTMCAFHCLYSCLPKDLNTLTSIYTDIGYYAEDNRSSDEAFWTYNCNDCLATYEVAEKLQEEMKEVEIWDYYQKYTNTLIATLTRMEVRGVRIDEKKRARLQLEAEARVLLSELRLAEIAGRFISIAANSKSCKVFLYQDMKFPPQFTKSKTSGSQIQTVDNKALSTLRRMHEGEGAREVLDLLIEARMNQKMLNPFLTAPLYKGRTHTMYGVGGRKNQKDSVTGAPTTGRLSSGKNIIFGSGTNMQNQPKNYIRRIFIPSEGCAWLRLDLSQAEARVVAYLAEEEKLIQLFEEGGDIHTQNASWRFHIPSEQVTKEQRQAAKSDGTHGFNYGLTPYGHSRNTGMTLVESKALYAQYFNEYPAILQWQQRIERHLTKARILTTPQGARRVFFERFGQPLLRSAFSFIPQKVVGDLINEIIVRLEAFFFSHPILQGACLLQVHDEVDFEMRRDLIQETLPEIVALSQIPIPIHGRTLIIPVEIEQGENWYDLTKCYG